MCSAVRRLGGDQLSPSAASGAGRAGGADDGDSPISVGAANLELGAPLQGNAVTAALIGSDAVRAMGARLEAADSSALCRDFTAQGEFIYLEDFLTPEATGRLVAAVAAVKASVNRNYLPGHKQGGSVSRHTIDQLAPFITELYRCTALIGWLGKVSGQALQVAPAEDPHAYALYFYTRAGDHIGWHYDTSYYAGRRYTLLLGVIEESSCRLEYELHTREQGVATVAGAVQIPPGGLAFFNGDSLRHRITPLADNETRVSLTFEYVTNPKMRLWWRIISDAKDAILYFGFRQVFRRIRQRHSDRP